MPVNILEIMFVIGENKFDKESNKVLIVSSPKIPNVKKSNIPPRPEIIASLKLPVS